MIARLRSISTGRHRQLALAGGFIVLILGGLPGGAAAQTATLLQSASPYGFSKVADLNGMAVFAGADGKLWTSDGTVAGTVKISDATVCCYGTPEFVQLGNELFFSANDGIHGDELWRTDGTSGGTAMVKDLVAGFDCCGNPLPSSPQNLKVHDGLIYFSAHDYGTNGRELWVSNGTAPGTMLLKDVRAGSNSSDPYAFTVFNSDLFFLALGGDYHWQLWKTDGTDPGTELVADIDVSLDTWLYSLTAFNGSLYFWGCSGDAFSNPSDIRCDLWTSDGTTTSLFQVFQQESSSELAVAGGNLFFGGFDANGYELWKTDGTSTSMVKDINTDICGSQIWLCSSSPSQFRVVGNTVLFTSYDYGISGNKIFRSDGTALGTVPIASYAQFCYVDVFNGMAYFSANNDGTHGHELWQTDGSVAGTSFLYDFHPGITDSYPCAAGLSDDILYVGAYDSSTSSSELWAVRLGPPDTSITSIALNPASPNGSNGWYVSDVLATVSVLEGISGLAETRCVLDPAGAPASFDDIPPGCAYTGAGADVTTNGLHTLYAASKDNDDSVETPVSSAFTIDKTPPTSTITFPVAGSYDASAWDAGCSTPAGDICGTSLEAGGAGLQQVEVSIKRNGLANKYWDGSTFTSTAEVFFLATGTTNWSYDFDFSSFLPGSYTVHARGTDNAGNVEASPTVTFTVTTAAPGPCGVNGVYTAPNQCTYSHMQNAGFEDTFEVPAKVTSLHVVAVGGRGGSACDVYSSPPPNPPYEYVPATGGYGASVTADVPVLPRTTLLVELAGNGQSLFTSNCHLFVSAPGGFNGGGDGGGGNEFAVKGGGGGGATDLRTESSTSDTTLDSRLVVAAGGGGGGAPIYDYPGHGGNADQDGTNGGGSYGYTPGGGGAKGTAGAGGAGGTGLAGQAGSFGSGGNGTYAPEQTQGSGGGGGGGYFGGGAGGTGAGPGFSSGGGGGGGSNFAAMTATGVAIGTDGTGTPLLTITWEENPDVTAPTTTVGLTGTTGNNGWYTSSVNVAVSADDAGGTGVAETRCVLDPGGAPASFDAIPAGCAYTGAGFDVTADGQHTLYSASVDIVDNAENPVVTPIKIDKTAPASTISFPTAAASYDTPAWNPGCSTPSTGDFCGTSADTSGSGVQQVEVSIKRNGGVNLYWDGSGFTSGAEVFFVATGTTTWSYGFAKSAFPLDSYTIHARATDLAGNVEASPTVTFTIIADDETAPTTTIALNPAAPDGLNGWYTSNVHATVSAVDNAGGSGVAETRCVLDPGAPPASFDAMAAGCAYAGGGADVITAGLHTLYAASKDNVGNTESPVVSTSFKIDKTAPVISTRPAGDSCAVPGTNGWCKGTQTAGFSVTDATSGVSTPCVAAGGASCDFTQQTATNGAAVTIASAGVCDLAGNCATSINSAAFKIDSVAPGSTIGFPTAAASYNTTSWNAGCTTPATGDFCGTSADTSGSGVQQVEASIKRNGAANLYWDGSGFTSGAEVFFVATSTTAWSSAFAKSAFPLDSYTIHARATDLAGNVEASPTVTFTIITDDTTAPTTTIALSPASPNGTNGWYTSNVHATVSAVDDAGGSGVAETRCVLDPGVAPASFAAIPAGCAYTGAGADVTTNGQHVIYAASRDNIGNTESPVVSTSFKIDKTAPVISTRPAGDSCAVPGTNGWCKGTQTAGFSVTDATSGVATPCVAAGGASCNFTQQTTTNGAAVTIASGGVCDLAGNCAASLNSAAFKIDSVAPAVAVTGVSHAADGFMPPESLTIFPATVGASLVAANGTSSDGTSGVLTVVVNAGGTSGTTTWTRSGLAIGTGGTTVTATATDLAGNTSSPASVLVTLNPDLDADGIANNVDGNSTVTPAVSKALVACTIGSAVEPCRFSDKQLGGQTSGRVTSLPAALSYMFTDAPGEATKGGSTVPAGLNLVVTGTPGRLTLTIDGSSATHRYPAGTYVVTDPAGVITVETIVGGPAELEYTLNGAPMVIVIEAGAVATITETTTTGGVLTDLGVAALAGTVTLNGQPVPVGPGLFLGTLTGKLVASRGAFAYAGIFTPAASSNGMNPSTESVTLTVGSYAFQIPAGTFKRQRDGSYTYVGKNGGVNLSILLKASKNKKWAVTAAGKTVTGVTSASPVKLRIGDDASP